MAVDETVAVPLPNPRLKVRVIALVKAKTSGPFRETLIRVSTRWVRSAKTLGPFCIVRPKIGMVKKESARQPVGLRA